MISIKLDTSAVNALFAGEDARVELQQAVVAEVCRRLFDKYVASDITKLVDGIFSAHKTHLIEAVRDDTAFRKSLEEKFTAAIAEVKAGTFNKTVKLKPEFNDQLDRILRESVDRVLVEKKVSAEQLIEASIAGAVARLTERALSRIDAEINKRFDKSIAEEIERRVRAALNKALEST